MLSTPHIRKLEAHVNHIFDFTGYSLYSKPTREKRTTSPMNIAIDLQSNMLNTVRNKVDFRYSKACGEIIQVIIFTFSATLINMHLL